MKKILITFHDAGGGHRNAAVALQAMAKAQNRDWDVELVQFQELTGLPWPGTPIDSANALVSLLAVLLADGAPSKLDEALAQASSLTMVEALEMVAPGEE